MTNNEEVVQPKESKSPEQLKNEAELAKVKQEKYKKYQEKFKAEQEKFKIRQEEERTKQRASEAKKRKIEIERLCFICFLSILVLVFSASLIIGGIWIYCSIKDGWCNTYNWIRLIFGSVMMVSFVVLIIVHCLLIKKLLYQNDE